MSIEHLSPADGPDRIGEILARDGGVIVDRVVAPERLDAVRAEMKPYLEAAPTGPDEFSGRNTTRVGGLVARSPASREVITHPLVLGGVKAVLSHATTFQLHLTQIIAIGPGESAQDVHRDQWAFDFFPFPKGFEVQCNTIWALTDFTEENGATRLIPGSQDWPLDRNPKSPDESIQATMSRGSVLCYSGTVIHGGGANRSTAPRTGLNMTYCLAWLRTEENQFLSCPPHIACELEPALTDLLGYTMGNYALGYYSHPAMVEGLPDTLPPEVAIGRGPEEISGHTLISGGPEGVDVEEGIAAAGRRRRK